MMAEAVGKMTGRPGICFVTRGPGASNASAGIHIACQDSSPMVMFVGQVGRDMRDREAFQELDYRAVFGTMAKWATEIDDPARIPEIVSRAFHTACNGRPGPVVIALPEDMLTERVVVSDATQFEPVETSPGQSDMSRLQDLLRGAKHPVVLIGGSRWSEQASASLIRFAERFALPVATTFRGVTWLMHDLYAGDFGLGQTPKLLARVKPRPCPADRRALRRMPSQSYSVFDIPEPQTTLVHVHPGADELGRVYHPHLAINATPTEFCAALDSCNRPGRCLARRQRYCPCRLSGLGRAGTRCRVPSTRRDHGVAAQQFTGRCDHHAGRGQLLRLGSPLYRVCANWRAGRRHVGSNGLRLACRAGDADHLSRPHCCVRRR
jgi:acetolactate synthase-1/2/3 large subunit